MHCGTPAPDRKGRSHSSDDEGEVLVGAGRARSALDSGVKAVLMSAKLTDASRRSYYPYAN